MVRLLLAACLAFPALAFAQAKVVKDKAEIKFNEIERGATVGVAVGWAPIFNLPGNSIDLSGGMNRGCRRGPVSLANEVVRIDVGADIGSRGSDPRSAPPLLVVNAMLQAAHAKAGADYLGTSSSASSGRCLSTDARSPSGDFAMLGGGLAAKLNLVGFADSQDVKRLWVYVRAAGGVNFYFPKDLIKETDVMLQGGAGIEYYTRLRHFAIGLEANFLVFLQTATFGMTVTPTLRYSF